MYIASKQQNSIQEHTIIININNVYLELRVEKGISHHSKFPAKKKDQSENGGHEIPFSSSVDSSAIYQLACLLSSID